MKRGGAKPNTPTKVVKSKAMNVCAILNEIPLIQRYMMVH